MRRAARGSLVHGPFALVVLVLVLVVQGPAALADETPPASVPAPSGPAAGAPRDVDAGGVLFVSGVRSTYHPSRSPSGGTLHVELTVRNAYTEVVDASATLAARTLLGIDLGGSSSLAVRDLQPGEVRVVSAEIPGVGQWGVLHVRAALTPPAEVSGVQLAPLERDRWVLAPPWYLLALVVLVGAAAWVAVRYRLVRGRRRPVREPAGGPAVVVAS